VLILDLGNEDDGDVDAHIKKLLRLSTTDSRRSSVLRQSLTKVSDAEFYGGPKRRRSTLQFAIGESFVADGRQSAGSEQVCEPHTHTQFQPTPLTSKTL
jgi:hypothetical protein